MICFVTSCHVNTHRTTGERTLDLILTVGNNNRRTADKSKRLQENLWERNVGALVVFYMYLQLVFIRKKVWSVGQIMARTCSIKNKTFFNLISFFFASTIYLTIKVKREFKNRLCGVQPGTRWFELNHILHFNILTKTFFRHRSIFLLNVLILINYALLYARSSRCFS